MVSITMKQLLEAGVHFGHQTKRWNPKMKEYIFGQRNGIYIIDLQKSIKLFKNAIQFVYELGSQGKTILFLGTKRQAQEAIQEAAQKTSTYYVNQRWLGGLLTNFVTIQKSIKRFRELETMRNNGQYDLFSKKEVARYERERKKLEKNLSGIKDMADLPDAVFVIDTKLETIAIKEAVKLGIPVIGVADTNCDPDEIDYIIPGNDDALRAIRLITDTIAQAFLDGKAMYEAQQKELAEQLEKQRKLQAEQAAAAREAAALAAAAAEAKEQKPASDVSDGAETEDTSGSSPEGVSSTADKPAKPKTTVRKTLQRKAKSKKAESVETSKSEAKTEPAPVTATVEEQATPAEEAKETPEPVTATVEEQATPVEEAKETPEPVTATAEEQVTPAEEAKEAPDPVAATAEEQAKPSDNESVESASPTTDSSEAKQ